jgi:hypothetical protein
MLAAIFRRCALTGFNQFLESRIAPKCVQLPPPAKIA